MANTIIGKILSIGMTSYIPTKSGNDLKKRQLVLDASRYDEYTGEKRDNFPSFTFMAKNCDKLDAFHVGELVEVSFIIQGRKYEKDGTTRFINDIVGYKIEAHSRNGQQVENTQTQQVFEAPQAPFPPVAEQPQNNPLPF